MIRHFNSTRRQTIQRADVKVRIQPSESQAAPVFDLELKLDRYDFPPTAVVRLEAWRSNAAQRWDYGMVGNLQPPGEAQRRLTEVPQSAQFKVFVVAGDGSGRLLGLSHAIKPMLPRESLIPLMPCDLGDEVWRIEFSEDDLPELQVNSKLEMISEIVRSDGQFRSLVMPQVLRSVLNYIVLVRREDPDDDAGGWWMGWYRLARSLDDSEIPRLDAQAAGASVEEAQEWIERSVAAFAAQRVDAATVYAQTRAAS